MISEKRHKLKCKWCNKIFFSDKNKQKLCSVECRIKWQNSDEYKDIQIKNLSLNTLEEREHKFKIRFEDKYKQFIYHSEYIHPEKPFKAKCKKCGNIKELNAGVARKSYKKNVRCNECYEEIRYVKELIKTTQKDLDTEYKKLNNRIRLEVKNEMKMKNLKCIQCGEGIQGTRIKKYCSSNCKKKANNKKKEIKRRNRIILNGEHDEISLDRLIVRDNNICHLCNDECNEKDYIISQEGYHIAGNTYPSIDHVKPISKGGTHTWDNVKLAHRQCNSLKSNNEEYKDTRESSRGIL